MKQHLVILLSIALTSLVPACGGDGGGSQTGTCLTDAQICSLASGVGVMTRDTVLKEFGQPFLNISGAGAVPTVSYDCSRVDSKDMLLYQQNVDLRFGSDSLLLTTVNVGRLGPEATTNPTCLDKLKN